MATATPSKDTSGPPQTTPMLKSRKNRRTRRKPQAAAQKSEVNDGEDDEDGNDAVADAWHYLPPAPNAVQGKQLEKALNPPPEKKQDGGKKDAFSIVLELNLEVEVTIKARIHGDLTLALVT